MRIQSTEAFQPTSASSSTTRIQLAAKDNSESSIDQKSEGCFSSLWNSFVSVLSSIWNFFTGCCKAKEKESSKEIKSKEVAKPELTSELLIEHLTEFREHVSSHFNTIIEKTPQTSSVESIWWMQIGGEKKLISTSVTKLKTNNDRHSCPDYSIETICNNAKIEGKTDCWFNALLITRNSEKEPYQVYRFQDSVTLEKSSNEFKQHHDFEGTTPKKIKDEEERNEYIRTFFHLTQFDTEILGALSLTLNFKKK